MEVLWKKLLANIKASPRDFHTHPKRSSKEPLWFYAETDGNVIYITNAKNHSPSCSISQERRLNFEEFKRIYPIYLKRESGARISQEATSASYNQVYWFSLLYDCLSEE